MWGEIVKRLYGLQHGIVHHYRANLSPNIRNILAQIGQQPIDSMKVVRRPLDTRTDFVVRIFGQNLPKTLYHLFIVMEIGEHKLIFEKSEVINISPYQEDPQDQYREVEVHEKTLQKLIENTQNLMGDKFYQYHPTKINCQDFVLNVLKANQIAISPELEAFILQPAQDFSTPFWGDIGKKVVQLASMWDLIKHGEGKGKKNISIR